MGDPECAERVVVDVFDRVWREGGLDGPEGEGQVLSGLLSMSRAQALIALRRRAAPTAGDRKVPDILSSVGEGSDAHSALARLSPLPREIVSLAFFRDSSLEDIARQTGVPITGVKAILTAALREFGGAVGEAAANPQCATFDAMLITHELARRPARPIDSAGEVRALRALAGELAKPNGMVLTTLVETALELCRAHSAGVSILDMEGDDVVFRWNAVAGAFAVHQGGSIPRDQSPCGIVVDRDSAQLVTHPQRHFSSLHGAAPTIVEALLVPFHMLGTPVGTVWVLSHEEGRHFDAEDCRVLTTLSQFAAAAHLLRSSQLAALQARDELVLANERLSALNTQFWSQFAAAAQH
ncbi:MAG: GAF domain-containing protein [Pseudomonadota bacterium]|nr:GAF domain-containing protein [Pseudomonadota bacterium]